MKRRYVGIGILVVFVLALLWWGLRPEKDQPLKASATISKPAMAAPRPPATRPAPNFPSAVAIAPAPSATANATSREPNNLGQVNLGIAPQKFVLKSGRLLVVSLMPDGRGNYTLNLGLYREGNPGRGIPLRGVGIRLRDGASISYDFGNGDKVSLTPAIASDANDLGVVALTNGVTQQFVLSSGQIVTIELDDENTQNSDTESRGILVIAYPPGSPVDGQSADTHGTVGWSGRPVVVALHNGEYMRFTPRF